MAHVLTWQAITSRPMIDINIDAVNREGFVQIISRDESLRITKSRYGRRENLLNSKALTPARLFRIMVDQTAVNKLNEEIADLKRRKVDFEKPWQDLGDKIRKVDDEVAKINGRLVRSADLCLTVARLTDLVCRRTSKSKSRKRKRRSRIGIDARPRSVS